MALLTVFRNANNKLMKMLRSLENYFISFPLRETILHNEKWMNEFISTVSLCWSSGNLERIDIWCWSSTSFCFQNTNSLFLWIPWIARGKKKSRAQSKYRNIIKTISCTFSSDKKNKRPEYINQIEYFHLRPFHSWCHIRVRKPSSRPWVNTFT